MTESQLINVVREVAKLVNPRVNKLLQHKGIAKDAVESIESSGGLITTVGEERMKNGIRTFSKTRQELLREISRGSYFANLKTSTVKGAREEQKRRMSIIQDKIPKGASQEQVEQMIAEEWDRFHKFAELNPRYDSRRLLELYKEVDQDQIQAQAKLDEWSEREYEGLQQAYKQAAEETGYKPKWEF